MAGVTLFLAFAALGIWQVERRDWKLALMQRVEERLHATPRPLPARADWPHVDSKGYEYLPVQVQGRWLTGKTVLTQATTELGAGFWVLSALQLDAGGQLLINRGFIPQAQRGTWAAGMADASGQTGGHVQIQGLLRISEPGGGYLRRNDPTQQRWHSRDVAAIAQTLGLRDAAPFFIDAGIPKPGASSDAATAAAYAGPWPRAGMTVVHFHNSHLVYAITWFGLAAMVAAAALAVTRYELRIRSSDVPVQTLQNR
ncbi:MAG: SURF1 family protein [Proteobacteria bacterium]|nr:SURF1 family protein [Pseudomonadota bacterium]MBS0302155.1 SURF1 family protein [Pseudomonadota bacterium]